MGNEARPPMLIRLSPFVARMQRLDFLIKAPSREAVASLDGMKRREEKERIVLGIYCALTISS